VVTGKKMMAPAKDGPAEEDDLTLIRGIGPVFARRLNQAGIYTFSQLAELKAEEVESITQVTRWDPADWIAEAKSKA
jgi:predicted flap endonuclease-1-like 5' DNA nuclease